MLEQKDILETLQLSPFILLDEEDKTLQQFQGAPKSIRMPAAELEPIYAAIVFHHALSYPLNSKVETYILAVGKTFVVIWIYHRKPNNRHCPLLVYITLSSLNRHFSECQVVTTLTILFIGSYTCISYQSSYFPRKYRNIFEITFSH